MFAKEKIKTSPSSILRRYFHIKEFQLNVSIAAHGGNTGTWIGGSDLDTEGVLKWAISGNALTFTDWTDGDPNNAEEEDCVALYDYQGLWVDIDCSESFRAICEHYIP